MLALKDLTRATTLVLISVALLIPLFAGLLITVRTTSARLVVMPERVTQTTVTAEGIAPSPAMVNATLLNRRSSQWHRIYASPLLPPLLYTDYVMAVRRIPTPFPSLRRLGASRLGHD